MPPWVLVEPFSCSATGLISEGDFGPRAFYSHAAVRAISSLTSLLHSIVNQALVITPPNGGFKLAVELLHSLVSFVRFTF